MILLSFINLRSMRDQEREREPCRCHPPGRRRPPPTSPPHQPRRRRETLTTSPAPPHGRTTCSATISQRLHQYHRPRPVSASFSTSRPLNSTSLHRFPKVHRIKSVPKKYRAQALGFRNKLVEATEDKRLLKINSTNSTTSSQAHGKNTNAHPSGFRNNLVEADEDKKLKEVTLTNSTTS